MDLVLKSLLLLLLLFPVLAKVTLYTLHFIDQPSSMQLHIRMRTIQAKLRGEKRHNVALLISKYVISLQQTVACYELIAGFH